MQLEIVKNIYESTMDDVRKALKDGLIKAEGIYKGSELIVFYGKSGYAVKMFHEQNCCEHVSVESIDNPDDIYTDTSFCRITESTNSSEDNGDMSYSYTWTFYNIQTDKGWATIRWYGESNGYYSEAVNFEILKIVDEELENDYDFKKFCEILKRYKNQPYKSVIEKLLKEDN